MNNQKTQSVKIAKMAMLVAVSIVLVMIIHFPIFPAVAFLEYDPADIPILIGTFAFGPVAGITLTIVTSLIQGLTVSSVSGLYGIIMHILATSALVLVAGTIYRRNKTKKSAVIGLSAATGSYDCRDVFRQYGYNTCIYRISTIGSDGSHAVYTALQHSESRYKQRGHIPAV